MMPMILPVLAWGGLALAAIPALLMLANLRLFRRAPPISDEPAIPAGLPESSGGKPRPRSAQAAGLPQVSVLVPARNEERSIGRLCRSLLGSRGVDLEIVVLDDSSEDGTATVVAGLAAADSRVRLVRGAPLPPGWCGKQHACWQLAAAARHDLWVFCDVDVTPAAGAVARSVALLDQGGAALLSGFPRQQSSALLDWLLLPLIHFVLLGFLPLARSRQTNAPGMAAGCGQWFVTTRAGYAQSGGHAGIRASLHDGVKLPRAYRRAGLVSDIFDAGDIVSCRMYDSSAAVWRGLAKNATEGIGSPATILPFTLLLGGGQVLPMVLVGWAAAAGCRGWSPSLVGAAVAGLALSYLPRFMAVRRFGQSPASAVLHPLAVTVLLVIQWFALIRRLLGFKTTWRGRRLAPQ